MSPRSVSFSHGGHGPLDATCLIRIHEGFRRQIMLPVDKAGFHTVTRRTVASQALHALRMSSIKRLDQVPSVKSVSLEVDPAWVRQMISVRPCLVVICTTQVHVETFFVIHEICKITLSGLHIPSWSRWALRDCVTHD